VELRAGELPDRVRTKSADSAVRGTATETLVTGSGNPVTVFAHGLAGSIAEVRPFGSAVAGSRVFFAFSGHGQAPRAENSSWPAGHGYAELADELAEAADAHGATRALGVSMGAGALCRLLSRDPGRFERLVLILPAVLDRPRLPVARARLAELATAVDSGDPAKVTAAVELEIPKAVAGTPAASAYVRGRVRALLGSGVAAALRGLPGQVAVPPEAGGSAVLASVDAPTLVIAVRGDPLHPVEVAERLAAALPYGELRVYDDPAAMWTRRADLRRQISTFLNRGVTQNLGGGSSGYQGK
jgi:pimeloyl-ACP methyl ester carboxylesterase